MKRKFGSSGDGGGGSRSFQLDEMNQDVLERVLSWLPTSSFFRLSSVCKRWKSAADSATFRRACSRVPAREPWFYMVDSHSQPRAAQRPVVFDSSVNKWRTLDREPFADSTPVATSGGLICFHLGDGELAVCNPVTRSYRRLDPLPPGGPPVRAVALAAKNEAFKVILVSGDLPQLKFREYDSTADQWGAETSLTGEANSEVESEDRDENCTQFFLSKCGDVVSTDFQRSPSKQFSSILTLENEDEILHFLSSSGSVVSCNLTRRAFSEYPRLLPEFSEHSIDLIECSGQMQVVLLSEFLETASLRVWAFDKTLRNWRQTAAMPPWMSHGFSGKKVDINCTATGNQMLVCANSAEICGYYMCDLQRNEWVKLPDYGGNREFVSAFSFEPRIEASVGKIDRNPSI